MRPGLDISLVTFPAYPEACSVGELHTVVECCRQVTHEAPQTILGHPYRLRSCEEKEAEKKLPELEAGE